MFKPQTTPPPNVRYIESDEWGLTAAVAAGRGLALQPTQRDEVYVHHTAGQYPDLTPATWDDDPIRFIQALDQRAVVVKEYKALDYSWVIMTSAAGLTYVIEGRGLHYPAATLDRNTQSKAYCYAGDFRAQAPFASRAPLAQEIHAGQWLTTELIAAGVLAPHVVGRAHRDNPAHPGATACCGDLLIPMVPFIVSPWKPAPTLPKPTLRLGSRGPEVYDLSALLVFLKHKKRPTSFYGKQMGDAVARLQKSLGIRQTRVYDKRTAEALAKALKIGV